MHEHAIFSLLRRGKSLAAPIPSTDDGRLAWVGVYPLDLSSNLTREFLRAQGVDVLPASGRAYHVRLFEVDRKLIDANVWIGEPQLQNKRSALAFNENELKIRLESFGIDFETLEPPFKSDYPI